MSSERKGTLMSIPTETNPTAVGVFQAHFGAPPGGHDAKADCEKWQRLCDEPLAERARLRTELEKARLEQIFREWDALPIQTMEEVYAQVDRETTIEQLIAEFEEELE